MNTPNQDNSIYRRVNALEAAVQEIQRTLKLNTLPTTTSPDTRVSNAETSAPLRTSAAPRVEQAASQVVASARPEPTSTPSRVRAVQVSQVPSPPPPQAPRMAQPAPSSPYEPPAFKLPSASTVIHAAETWFNKVGIVIFLFGVAFLFKYSIDRGWLNEQVRVGMGLLFGTVLVGLGMRLHGKRRHFSQVLMGGGIATYYITGFAAYNLFPDLNIPYQVAFGFMALVTVAAFALSVRQDEPVLSIIGIAGGLLTPFILNQSGIQLPALVAYTCLVIAGACGIYMMRGWRSLLSISLLGGWCILLLGHSIYITRIFEPALGNRWSLQGGAAFMLLAFWAIPVLREALFARNSARWARPTLASWNPELRKMAERQVYLLTIGTPLMALGFSANVWSSLVSKEWWGVVAIVGAGLFATSYLALRRYAPSLQSLAYTHAIMAITLLTVGLAALLEGDTLLFTLAAEGAALHLLARYTADRGIAIYGNLVFTAVGGWLASRLLLGSLPFITDTSTHFNSHALTDLAVIAVALATSFVPRQRNAALIMRNLAHLAVMWWLWREIHTYLNGDGYVMLAWAAYFTGVALFSHYIRDRATLIFTSVPFLGVAYLFAMRALGTHDGELAIFNLKTLLDVAVIGLALATSFVAQPVGAKIAFRLAVYAAVMGLLWRELVYLETGFNSPLFAFISGHYGYVMLAWAAFLSALHVLAWRTKDEATSIFAHMGFIWVGGLLTWRLATAPEVTTAIFNQKALIDLAVIALAACISFMVRPNKAGIFYRYAVHVAVLALLARELHWLTEGDGYIMLSWAAYATLLHVGWRWLKADGLDMAAHALSALTGGWLLAGIVIDLIRVNEDRTPVFSPQGLTSLGVVALGAVAYMLVRSLQGERQQKVAFVYALWLHFAFLGWTWQEIGLIPGGSGNAYVSIMWGIYAVVLVVAGLRLGRNLPLLTCGIATLFALAAKLFLIDLQYVDAIWRILLFLGFGGFFLLFSYFFQGAVERDARNSGPAPRTPGTESPQP